LAIFAKCRCATALARMTIWAAQVAKAKGVGHASAPNRRAALDHLRRFVPRAVRPMRPGATPIRGRAEPPPSRDLSPAIRYRLVTEQDVVAEVLRRHSFSGGRQSSSRKSAGGRTGKAGSNCGRSVWRRYLLELEAARDRTRGSADLRGS
jgi:deoxyribodipyrimidine photo-lyase